MMEIRSVTVICVDGTKVKWEGRGSANVVTTSVKGDDTEVRYVSVQLSLPTKASVNS